MSEKTKIFSIIVVILAIFIVLPAQNANAHDRCDFECDVPYRIATDGFWYPDGSVPFQYGQVYYFDCNCVKVIILNEYHGSIAEAADIQHWNAVRNHEIYRTHNRNR